MARVFIDTADLESAVSVREVVSAEGHDIEMVDSVDDAETRVREGEDEVALFVTGDLERSEARALIDFFGSNIPRPPLVGVTRIESPELRHRVARRHGLDEVLPVPPKEEEVEVVLDQQLERYRLQLETGLVGRTEAMREVMERIHLIAPVKSTVLLTGESGTGKELVARAVHRFSPRRDQAFIAVNCASLPESLLESELFGHEKGAFTGATSRRKGMFELADGGSILLDEIAEMPPALQTRLLRVLETRRFMRVGGESEIHVDVRVIAATNQDLRSAVQGGRFRRDLYYRLNVLHVDLPPLRERKEDIPVLVRRFVHEFSESHDRDFKGISPEAMEEMMEYSWPGNVRELRNLVESMVVLAPGSVIRPEDIPAEIRSGGGRSMLPARRAGSDVAEQGRPSAEGAPRSRELDLVFRTLIDLKLDVEDLRREFDRFRERHPELIEGDSEGWRAGEEIEISALEEFVEEVERDAGTAAGEDAGAETADAEEAVREAAEAVRETAAEAAGAAEEEAEPAGSEPEGAEPEKEPARIQFEPGMTMKELEREAIVATLKEVDGNRRKAAEKLGIGERTLYRKLREYDIDL